MCLISFCFEPTELIRLDGFTNLSYYIIASELTKHTQNFSQVRVSVRFKVRRELRSKYHTRAIWRIMNQIQRFSNFEIKK